MQEFTYSSIPAGWKGARSNLDQNIEIAMDWWELNSTSGKYTPNPWTNGLQSLVIPHIAKWTKGF